MKNLSSGASMRLRRAARRTSLAVKNLLSGASTLLLFLPPLLALMAAVAMSSRAQDVPSQSAGAPAPVKSGASGGGTAGAREGNGVAARGTGSITGQVFDEGGQPLVSVTVFAYSRGAGAQMSRASAATGEDGEFNFDNLEPGVYNLSAQAPGYTFETAGSTNLNNHRVGDSVTIRMVKGGVVTGLITNSDGEPVVNVAVRAIFLRELEGAATGPGPPFRGARDFQTDDRGVYRIYGLTPGVYAVSAGGPTQWRPLFNAYDDDAPTYFPSSTVDAAAEVVVRAGQEVAGIDIRYRGERGHTVSGRVEGAVETSEQGGTSVMLVHAPTGAVHGRAWISAWESERGFSFDGVGDGDYELRAQRVGRDGYGGVASAPQRVTVRGADVTGLKLALAPRASISGTVILEPLPGNEDARAGCQGRARRLVPQEVVVAVRRDELEGERSQPPSRFSTRSGEAVPDARGEFTLRGLDAGLYRPAARTLPEDWYVRSVSFAGAGAPKPRAGGVATRNTQAGAAARSGDGLLINAGQQFTGLTVTLAEGAAQIRGRVVTAPEEGGPQAPTSPLRVYLVPAERERAGDALHFHEAVVGADGSFTLSNLAPGRYLILARAAPVRGANESTARPLAWDADARAALRREAESAGAPLDLQPCQRVADYSLRHPMSK